MSWDKFTNVCAIFGALGLLAIVLAILWSIFCALVDSAVYDKASDYKSMEFREATVKEVNLIKKRLELLESKKTSGKSKT